MNFLHSPTKFEYLPVPLDSIISPPSLSDTKRIDHPRSTLTIVQVKGISINYFHLHSQFCTLILLLLHGHFLFWEFWIPKICLSFLSPGCPELHIQNSISRIPYLGFHLANSIVRIQVFRSYYFC